MRRKLALLSLLVVAVTASTYWSLKSPAESPSVDGLEIGSPDDPYARLNFEKMRLMDPETQEIPENIAAREAAFVGELPVHRSQIVGKKADEWTQRGPHNIGGRTRAIAIDVNNSAVILVGSVTGGVYRSENAGESWARVNTPSNLNSVTDIIQDTREGKTDNWYFCSGEIMGNLMVYPGDGIYKSTDGGKSFKGLQIVNKPQQYRNINYAWRMVIDHTRNDSDILYLASWGSLLRSNDDGLSWKTVLGGKATSASQSGSDIAISPTGVLYATMSSNSPKNGDGLWRSEDGLQWTNIKPLEFPATYGRIVLDIFDSDESIVYFLGLTPNKGKFGTTHSGNGERNSLWRYEYLGGDGTGDSAKWEDRSEQIPDLRQTDGYIWGDFVSQGGYDLVLRVHPRNEDSIVIGGTNLYTSTDGFTTGENSRWVGGYKKTKDRVDAFYTGLVYPNHHPDQHNLIFHPTDFNKAFSANDGGIQVTNDIWESKDEVEWINLNQGYYTTQYYTISMNQNPSDELKMSDIILGGFQDNETQYVAADAPGDADWTRIACCDGSYSGVFDKDENTYVVASKQLGTMYMRKYSKDGESLGAARIDPDGGANYLFINPFVHNPNHPEKVYLAGGYFVWKNKDVTTIPLSGTDSKTDWNWVQLSESQTAASNIITSIDCSTEPANILYYGTQSGNIYRIDDVNDDENYTVADLNANGKMNGNTYMSSISIDPNDADNVLVCFSNYNKKSIFYSADGGQTFTDVSGNLEENEDGKGAGPACHVVKIIRDAQNQVVYLVGTTSGLYSTTGLPGTATIWNRESNDLIGNCSVRDIDYRTSDGLLLVGTHGCGSFSTHIDEIASTPQISETTVFELYPNPASDFITYKIETHIPVNATIFNMEGQVVKTVDNIQNQGQIAVSELTKGSYFMELSNKEVSVRKQFVVQ